MTTNIDFPDASTLSESTQAAPSIAASLAFASAREQLQALADGRVSAVELLEHALARIERHDGALNAIPVRAIAQARRDAQAADAALQRGERKPLLGLPITVKENFDVAGLPTTVGNPDYRSNIARQDAPAVAALRAAGAVLIGKSNVPLALSDLQSYNAVYGSSNNPWICSARRVAHPAAVRRPWPRALWRWSWVPTLVARCASPRTSTACLATRPAMG